MQVVHPVHRIYPTIFRKRLELWRNRADIAVQMKRVKAWLKRLDERLGAWLARKYPHLVKAQEFGAGSSFGGDLQIKVIRGKPNEKKSHS